MRARFGTVRVNVWLYQLTHLQNLSVRLFQRATSATIEMLEY